MSHHLTLSRVQQGLEEEKRLETLRRFEKESSFVFDEKYFSELGMKGDWDEAEKYVSGFITIDQTKYTMNIYFQIWLQKFLEAIDKKDYNTAVKILQGELRYIETHFCNIYIELTKLLAMVDFRKHPMLMYYKDSMCGRRHAVEVIHNLMDLHLHS